MSQTNRSTYTHLEITSESDSMTSHKRNFMSSSTLTKIPLFGNRLKKKFLKRRPFFLKNDFP